MAKNQWKFRPLKSEAIITVAPAVGTIALGAVLSTVFTPLALGIAGAYAGLQVAEGLLGIKIPAYKKWKSDRAIKNGSWQPLSGDYEVIKIATELSNQLGRPVPPDIYIVDEKFVAKAGLPFGLRWLMKIPEIHNKAMVNFFAEAGANRLFTTGNFLNKMSGAELRFVVAHEMSHLHTDYASVSTIGREFVKAGYRSLFWMSIAAAGAAVVGVGIPAIALGGSAIGALATLLVTSKVASIALNIGTRYKEARADRNGVYLTGDLEGAKKGLAAIDPSEEKPTIWLEKLGAAMSEPLRSHASYYRRISALTKAFAEVAKIKQTPQPAVPAAASVLKP
jgi:Zn-dependent protease with chaperone function